MGTFDLDGALLSQEELETRLDFKYLPQISFETIADQKEVFAKGMAKLQNHEIKAEALELGKLYADKIHAAYSPPVLIRKIDERVGFGLYAQEKIASGSYVGEYTGIVRKNDRRYTKPLNDYCFEYPIPDQIGRSYVIDATDGNLTRFINHSYQPNLKPIHVFLEGYYHVIFVALRDIEKGTQLSYDYGHSYWHVRYAPVAL
ncbi:MAG: SET domain-containing protein-lysine N-methyltransferase [Verrucomicrobia bacterium]|nr:SET domain-containing protein-lysine N-methyltransferase [Verrucomicrobiota bacterium]